MPNENVLYSEQLHKMDGMVFFKLNSIGTVTFISSSWKLYMHYTISESIDKKLSDFMAEDSSAIFNKFINSDIDLRFYDKINFIKRDKSILSANFEVEKVVSETSHHYEGVVFFYYPNQIKIEKELEYYRQLIKCSTDCFVVVDAEGKQNFISEVVEKMTGFKAKDLYGDIKKVIHPEDLPSVLQKFKEAAENPEKLYSLKYRHIHKTKGYVWLEANGKSYLNNPVINGFIVSVRDISEQVSREAQILENEKKYEEIFNFSPVILALSDFETGAYIEVNEQFLKTLKFKREDVIGKTASELNILEKSIREKLVNQYNLSGKLITKELTVVNSDGENIVGLLSGRDFYINEKKLWVTSFYDITEIKKYEKALKESEEKFRSLVDFLPDGVVVYKDFTLLYSNESAARIMDFPSVEEFLGQNVLTFVHPDCRESTTQLVEKVMKENIVGPRVENIFVTKTGRLIHVEVVALPVLFNQEYSLLIVFRDISEKKKLVEASLRYQKLESLGVLAGGIAHDFNNLLGSLYGYASIIECSVKDEKVLSFIKKISSTLEDAKALTQKLLTFSKGGEPLKEICSITVLIQDIIKFYKTLDRIIISTDITENLWMCNVDKSQISQVLSNILVNSREAMPLGGRVRVVAENYHADIVSKNGVNDFVKISVIDTGSGINREIIEKIFDPFFSTKEKGHGLGLATSYSIINKHNGFMEVESESGMGTTVSIFLPAIVS
ncbi:MAG: PAS domain S-box protein [Candidatus Delongbacteria bacterium]|nr:PAS domain S-box protein [Candidatus Delongbacteria bacterium]MBN2835857.1 PAS domain S-box protein [Candidatus Delongbacteria bacterium]